MNHIRNVLIVSDNFWVGGRETFIRDSLHILRQLNFQRVYLLANRVENPEVEKLFTAALAVDSTSKSDLTVWLESSKRLIQDGSIDLVWVQHYASLQGLHLAQFWNAKLHITLHGPPLSAAPLTSTDALGLALAAERGATISGVSSEILLQVAELSSVPSHQILLLNRVVSPGNSVVPSRLSPNATFTLDKPIHLVLFTRQSKLNHIRAATKLLASFIRKGNRCKLTIYTGITPENASAAPPKNQWVLGMALLGKKWLIRNLDVFLVLKQIAVKPLTQNVEGVIQSSDIVLGMGRVVLEGLANRKVSILIGYEEVIGVVDSTSFTRYQQTNFSGRQQTEKRLNNVVEDAIRQLSTDDNERNTLQAHVDIERAKPQYLEWLKWIESSSIPSPQLRISDRTDGLNTHNQNEAIQVDDVLNISDRERIVVSKLISVQKAI